MNSRTKFMILFVLYVEQFCMSKYYHSWVWYVEQKSNVIILNNKIDASLACTDFPKCLNQWWPANMNFYDAFTVFNLPDINYEKAPLVYEAKLAIHFTHRIGAMIITLLYN